MQLNKRARGRVGEELAGQYLCNKGWRILEKNYRSRRAELDLIGLDGQTLVFVEVKRRTTDRVGAPEEAVDARKVAKMYQAANLFLKANPQHAHRDCRFDVVAIEESGSQSALRHLVDVACMS